VKVFVRAGIRCRNESGLSCKILSGAGDAEF